MCVLGHRPNLAANAKVTATWVCRAGGYSDIVRAAISRILYFAPPSSDGRLGRCGNYPRNTGRCSRTPKKRLRYHLILLQINGFRRGLQKDHIAIRGNIGPIPRLFGPGKYFAYLD